MVVKFIPIIFSIKYFVEENNKIKIMFVIPCKYTNQSPILECVKSINFFHPDEKIVVVDSNSEDVEYINKIKKINNVIVLDKKNLNYEIGALWIAYNNFPKEHCYVLIHDSVILKQSLNDFMENDETYNFLYFNETIFNSEENYLRKVLSKTDYVVPTNILIGCFGSMMVIKNKTILNMYSKKLPYYLLPTNKFESQICERILGLCLSLEGVNMVENSIEGDGLSKVDEMKDNLLSYIQKKNLFRK
jgi:Ni,Fe-hydrogenase maturation factor